MFWLLWLMDEKGQRRTEEDVLLQWIFIMVDIIVILVTSEYLQSQKQSAITNVTLGLALSAVCHTIFKAS